MSYFRTFFALPLVLAAALVLAGCSVRPLYAPGGVGETSQAQFSSIRIQPIPDREGQILHNKLRNMLNPYGQPRDPEHVLVVRLRESRDFTAVRRSETATRENLTIEANFALQDSQTRQDEVRGLAIGTVGYNVNPSGFATYVSEQDGRERALEGIAQEIRRRVGLYFAAQEEGIGPEIHTQGPSPDAWSSYDEDDEDEAEFQSGD